MSTFDEFRSPEIGPEGSPFVDLVDQLGFVVDDAFNDSLNNYRFGRTGKSVVELVQMDTHSLEDEKLFSVLLTESGGKAEVGVEKIRVLARRNGNFNTVRQAVESLLDDYSTLPYITDGYFIEHQNKDGEWRYSRVDEQGIHSWLPNLKDIRNTDIEFSLEDVNIFDALKNATELMHQPDYQKQLKQLRQLDEAYARELIAKLDECAIVPQN